MIQNWISAVWDCLEKMSNDYFEFAGREKPPAVITLLFLIFMGMIMIPGAIFLTIVLGIIDVPFWLVRK